MTVTPIRGLPDESPSLEKRIFAAQETARSLAKEDAVGLLMQAEELLDHCEAVARGGDAYAVGVKEAARGLITHLRVTKLNLQKLLLSK
jgi:hypothetical protein